MDTTPSPTIAAVVAAAGFSRRMGGFKQLLPWGDTTVIRSVVDHLAAAGADPIVCVTGHRGDEVAAALADSKACIVSNPRYVSGEMLTSYQAGIGALRPGPAPTPRPVVDGSLLVLADQPHIPVCLLRQVINQARLSSKQIVVPSHQKRRGHPIYLPAGLWGELLDLAQEASLRDLLNRHSADIVYVDVDTDAIRRDMDEWEEYEKLRREFE